MKVLAIKFGDNDFVITMTAFGELFLKYKECNGFVNFSKEQIVQIWNELVPGIYLMFQNRFRYDCSDYYKSNYLKIDESKVFFDEDAKELFHKCMNGWGNQETLFIWFDDRHPSFQIV